jgi:hypothetical protein
MNLPKTPKPPYLISRRCSIRLCINLKLRRNVMRRSAIIGLAIFSALAIPTAPAVALVATYHYDNHRSGWNQNETTLTPANVGPTTFGVLAQVVLDSQVDAQPLVVPHQQINGDALDM